MTAGRPIVASRVGGNLETVIDRKTGLLVTPDSVDPLAEAIIYLLDHPEIAQDLGEQGMKEVKQRFGIAETARKMIKLYEKWV
jgi:glycosyltransferase involved in cell wall biosynthesis